MRLDKDCLARTVIAICLFLLVALPKSLLAKPLNFTNVAGGVGLIGGVNRSPVSNVAGLSPRREPRYESFFGGELFIFPEPLLVLRMSFTKGKTGVFEGALQDSVSARTYNQSANFSTSRLGGKLSWNFLISDSKNWRIFAGGGGGKEWTKANIMRAYTSGGNEAYAASARGSGSFWNAHLGYATFLAQNWSFAIEVGVERSTVSGFEIGGDRNLRGDLITSNRTLYTEELKKVSWGAIMPQGQVSLQLNY